MSEATRVYQTSTAQRGQITKHQMPDAIQASYFPTPSARRRHHKQLGPKRLRATAHNNHAPNMAKALNIKRPTRSKRRIPGNPPHGSNINISWAKCALSGNGGANNQPREAHRRNVSRKQRAESST